MNFRLPAFALLTVLLALPHAYGQMSGASYLETIDQAPTTLTLNSSSSVVGLETPPHAVSGGLLSQKWPDNRQRDLYRGERKHCGCHQHRASQSHGRGDLVSLPPDWRRSRSLRSTVGTQIFWAAHRRLSPRPSSAPRISVSRSRHFPLPRGRRQLRRSRSRRSMASTARSHSVVPHRPPRWIAVCRRPFSLCRLPQSQTTTSASAGSVALSVTTFATTVEKAGLLGAFLLSFLSFKRRKHLALLGAVMLALLLTGCGTGTRYVQQDGTPKGTYSVTVTGTSGKLSHTQTVLVTVR